MTPSTQHVAVTPLGPSTAATVIWRLRGQLHVTVVVKATFALVPEGRMSLVKPEPIAFDEQLDLSGRGLRTAGDLAPYRAQCDVVVTGHAELPPGFSSPEVTVRLMVVQAGQVRIDKQARLDGAARVGVARSHVRIDGMGPLSRTSPVRSRLLAGVDPRRLAGLQLDIPERLDGSYFQAAPADQRLGALRGDEWIVLGGMIAQRPKLRTQLPDARGVARLYRRQRPAPRAGEPIPLRADTVHVDVDRRCCSVVWRGHAPVDVAELASLRIVAGVEIPTQPIAWRDPFASESGVYGRPASAGCPPPGAPALSQGVEGGPLGETNPLSPEEAARARAAATTPFDARRTQAGLARAVPPVPAMPAVSVSSHRPELLAPNRRDGSPLAGSALVAEANPLEDTALVVEAKPHEAKLHGANPLEAKPHDARPHEANPLDGRPHEARPHEANPLDVRPHEARPHEANSLEETNALSAEEAARLVASAATPFDARRQPAAPARSMTPATPLPAPAPQLAPLASARPGGDGNPLEETNALSPEDAARLLTSATTPFEARRAPAELARTSASAPAIWLPSATSHASTPAPVRPTGGHPLEGTNLISLEEAVRLRASLATPFEARRAPASALVEPSPPPWAGSSSAPVAPFYPSPPSHEAHFVPAARVTSPSLAVQPIVPPPGLVEASELPKGLGAQFLAAMADVALPAD